MQPHAHEAANGQTMTQPLDRERIDADFVLSRHDQGSTDAAEERPQTNRADDPADTPEEAPDPTGQRDVFVWQQFRWILSHGMLP